VETIGHARRDGLKARGARARRSAPGLGINVRLDFVRLLSRGAASAGLVTALLAGTSMSASAYETRWWFDPAPPPAPAAQPMPDVRPSKATRMKAARHKLEQDIKTAKPGKAKEAEKLPSGPMHIVISIRKQQLTLYAGGVPVAHSPVSTGVPGHPTPQGIFSVIQKEIYHESNLYSAAPMPYMQRITWSGVAMHQGVVPGHPASHGCIRLPREFAQRLWRTTKVGVRVIIAQDDVALSDIANPRLFTALPVAVGDAKEAAPRKVRVATTGDISDMPLKGSINANPSVEATIDQAVQAGVAAAEAYIESANQSTALQKSGPSESAKDPMLKPGPISVFISRKQNMLYVRKGFAPVFETPVTIAGDQPLGTHIFTALAAKDDGSLRWNVASLPTERVVKAGKYVTTYTPKGEKLRKELAAPTYEMTPIGDPNAALDRIAIPENAVSRITELMTPGASLIISDLGPSYETGAGTDFIILTR
jgi:lipoprotein-anchoring transpeptidase ErfK/SrfK